ncbi:MAG: hypothetical protein LBG96_07680 [Tannerella sp.]|nr:hypothetical protein [Tannerella sp.]
MGSIENTGMIPWMYSYDRERSVGSSYLRVIQLTKNHPEFEQYAHGKRYDNLIFQQFCREEMMRRFTGPKILDICDPNWLQYDMEIVQTGSLVHAFTCSSEGLTRLIKPYFPDKIVEHVPDRLDLNTFPPPREPHQGKALKAVWFGYIHNAYETLPQLLPALKETALQLRIIANLPYCEEDGISEWNPEFIYYDRATVYERIREADILLNPRSDRAFFRYKSNNKSLVGWRLGLPVAVTGEDVARLMNPDERNREVSAMQPVVEREYHIGRSAEQYRDIIYRIRQQYF